MPEATAAAVTPDESLVGPARAGVPEAREELFRRHYSVAYHVAHRYLGHDQDALDAVQEAFCKALIHLDDFDGRSGFRTWLLRIVTNAALDLGRKRKRRKTLPLEDDERGRPESAVQDDPSAGLHRLDLKRALDHALKRLSDDKRMAFILFHESGLSYKEIAEIQRVPIGTIMSRLYDARQKLQSYLADVGGID